MYYVSGGGTKYNGGIWERKETPKTITFTCIEANWDKLKFRKFTKNTSRGDIRYSGYGSVMIDEEDGTYTIYPDQCGTPHIFEPLLEPKIAEQRLKNVTLPLF